MEKLSGASTFCLFGQDAKISLAQIILGSDYSGSVKDHSVGYAMRLLGRAFL